ncbi:MAG: hypothetical protein ABL993_09100 [Vicinamibacterales bacterium]
MQVELEFVDEDPVFRVPIQTVGLFDEENPAGGVCFQKGEHLAKAAAPCLFRRLDVHELTDDRQAVVTGVLAEQSLLRGDREAFTFLVL